MGTFAVSNEVLVSEVRQPAPIRGESMETIIIQNLTANRPLDPHAPLPPDRRESQHITVDQPDSIRHISDPNRYLINRDNPIGGHAIEISDIEADSYYDDRTRSHIAAALVLLERRDSKKPVFRKRIVQISQMLRELVLRMMENRQVRLSNLATLMHSHAVRLDESSGAHVSANEVDWAARPDGEAPLVSQALDVLLPTLERQNQVANLLLGSLHDVLDNRYRTITGACFLVILFASPPSKKGQLV
ncbi:predicted protein [Sclerotinia sclerotiorum 1980 UF-70]|uniref:Uncharacterized protein n=2 Tax=Sclerotinia sclerotiorum (strain ATCC 18683 / 1980 / Ss-1) TaxID=665079 RepID=A7EVU3_SCLS1|nr:predicted protein [Sclerotinia sclerotiorum 1980 UF-70]APA15725.1 hypothetical protein sscle_15g104950 [Sclerotinia sclerotiorum 1980 UF-70]EDN93585.1 predicted protein [Sclerotinia sclerotiorum 1980 UF-70]